MVEIEEESEEPQTPAESTPAADDTDVVEQKFDKSVQLQKRAAGAYVPKPLTPGETLEKPKYETFDRSICTVRVRKVSNGTDESAVAEARILEFVLGETEAIDRGMLYKRGSAKDPEKWVPPLARDSTEVPLWFSDAARTLVLGEVAEFELLSAEDKTCSEVHSVELLELALGYDLLGDGGIFLRHLVKGDKAGSKPEDLAKVEASWKVWFQRNSQLIVNTATPEGTEMAPEDAELDSESGGRVVILDEGLLLPGIELALREMTPGGHLIARINEKWGCGPLTPSGNPILKGAAIWVQIVLHSVQNEAQMGELNTVQARIDFALVKKDQGNEKLKTAQGDRAELGRAMRRYEPGIKCLQSLIKLDKKEELSRKSHPATRGGSTEPRLEATEEDRPKIEEVLTALQLNASLVQLKREEWSKAVDLCSEVLRRSDDNVKAHYRRGVGRIELADYDGAVEDLRKVVSVEPKNADARKELSRAEEFRKEHRRQEKELFGGLCNKMEKDSERQAKIDEAKQRAEEERRAAQEKLEQEEEAKRKEEEDKKKMEEYKKKEEERRAEEERKKAEAAKESRLPVGSKGAALLESLGADVTTTMEPAKKPAFKTWEPAKQEPPPEVNYNVPTFLKRKKQGA